MVTVNLSLREVTDILVAFDYAIEDYLNEERAATTDMERHLYEAKTQRLAALHHKLTAAQPKAQ